MTAVSQVERASRAWPVLTAIARRKEKISYGDIGKALGIHHRAVRFVLSVIQSYCLEEELPPLTILVINQSGKPGTGFIACDINRLDRGYAEVWGHDWSKEKNPFDFASDGTSYPQLVKTLTQDPDSSVDVYTKVKSRGIQQLLFREALLKAYGHQCAFTGLSFPEALEACHIVPWSESSNAERMDIRNGVLLNSFHHRLFDKGLITFTENYKIWFFDPKEKDGHYSKMDSALTSKLHGKSMHVPFLKKQRPLAEYIRKHHEAGEWKVES